MPPQPQQGLWGNITGNSTRHSRSDDRDINESDAQAMPRRRTHNSGNNDVSGNNGMSGMSGSSRGVQQGEEAEQNRGRSRDRSNTSSSSQVSSDATAASRLSGMMSTVRRRALQSYEDASAAVSASGPNNRRALLVLLVVLALVVLVMIVAFVIYQVQRGDLKAVTVVHQPLNMTTMTKPRTTDKAKLPPTLNGQEYSNSFWVYLFDYQPTASHKMLFMRGGNGTTVANASPIVFMDQTTNKLYVAARTTLTPVTGITTLADVMNVGTSMYAVATIEYVPLQRWVHIVASIKDSTMTLYFDGKLYTVSSVNDVMLNAKSGTGVRPLFSGTAGDMTVGMIDNTSACRAFLARVQVLNYAMTGADAEQDYRRGPASASIMGALGLPQYGVRAPVYRTDDTSA